MAKKRIRRAMSVDNVMQSKYKTLPFEGKWKDGIGCPEITGSWVIMGPPKNGKTSFAMMLSKYLTNFLNGAYNSIEEGNSLSIQEAMKRVSMDEVSGKLVFLDKMPIEEMEEWLKMRNSPDFLVIDSIQFADMTWVQYKRLKECFTDKIFIFISHIEGRQPEGSVAKRIYKDANVTFMVEGFRAFPRGRYGGGASIDVSEELADAHWGLKRMLEE